MVMANTQGPGSTSWHAQAALDCCLTSGEPRGSCEPGKAQPGNTAMAPSACTNQNLHQAVQTSGDRVSSVGGRGSSRALDTLGGLTKVLTACNGPTPPSAPNPEAQDPIS